MNYRKLLFSLIFIAVAQATCVAGRHSFNTYSVENGLANNSVGAIMQDGAGFIWLGTRGGLCRFDGTAFLTVDLPSVNALAELPHGNLLAGTDEGLFVWDKSSGTCLPYLREDGQSFGAVTRIRSDKDGSVWVLVPEQGLFRLAKGASSCSLLLSKNDKSGFDPGSFNDILPDSEGLVWISCSDGTLLRFDARRELCTRLGPIGNGKPISCISDEDEDNLILGLAEGGVLRVGKRDGKASPIVGRTACPAPVHTILKSNKEELWIGTESGLFILDRKSGELTYFASEIDNSATLPDNSILTICEDAEGGVWLGTSRGGAAYTTTEQNFVTLYIPSGGRKAFHGKTVRDFVEDGSGVLWIGTEDSGVYSFDSSNAQFTDLAAPGGPLPYLHISSLNLDGNELMAGLSQQGFCTYNTVTGSRKVWSGENSPGTVLSIFKDSEGVVWLGTKDGLVLFDASSAKPFTRVLTDELRSPVQDICEDRAHCLWLACYGEGLRALDAYRQKWTLHDLSEGNPESQRNRVLSVTLDNHDNLWIGTEGGGACRFDPVSGSLTHFSTETGLPSNTVYKILEDKLGNIWFSTSKGLSRLSTETGNYITYTYNYGAPSNQFNYKSGIKASNGKLYFGTVRGFMEVTPEDIRTNYAPPRVVFTGYTCSGKDFFIDSYSESLQEVKMKYDQTNVSFRFAPLSYTAPQNIRYSYRLKGLDKEATLTRQTEIHYSRIPAGKYILEISAANGDGPWADTPAQIRILVTPHFLASAAGITLEILLTIAVLLGLYLNSRRRLKEHNLQEIKRMQDAERSAAQKMKIDFFASIIHEIRTPLSLIKAPFEQIKKYELPENEKEENMKTMEANIDRLLQLSNEILDFSRIEENAFTVRPKRTDVNQLVEEVTRSFSFHIMENRYSIVKYFPEQPLIAWVDPEILIKIVSNLLGNAVKFADSQIIITLEDAGDVLRFTVSNDGAVIPLQDREKVFQAFYRENRDDLTSGTGLGLPLVKQLSELHGGRVFIDSRDDKMNTFVVELPKGKAPETEESLVLEEKLETTDSMQADKRTIAIVDDDTGIRLFLKKSLSHLYNVIGCPSGKSLYEAMETHMVDMVITDIMMPETDGIALCNSLKTSFEYSHIPVILLSARVDSKMKMDGLEAECDAFIEKPFTLEFLEGQIENIFARQDRLREYYAKDPHLDSGAVSGGTSDQEFISRITALITEHLDDDDFNIDSIADILSMSRSTLYRKIRGITSFSPNEFIQTIRLKKAAELLSTGRYRVSEVGFLVGFSSVAYFSTCFRKQFGISPTEFKKNHD